MAGAAVRPRPSSFPVTMAQVEINGIRKSAILLLSLGQDEASAVLKLLPREMIDEVSREIAQLTRRATALGMSPATVVALVRASL